MIGDRLTNWFSDVAEQILYAMSRDSEDRMVESTQHEDDWRPADSVIVGSISMYHNPAKREMATYYNGYFPPNALLESYYNQIQQGDAIWGEEMASRLMEPFQKHKSQVPRADWLNSAVINTFFKTLEFSEKIAHLDSSYHQTKDFFSSLHSADRTNLCNKLKAANLIFWPYCDDRHWYLLLIERVHGNVFTVKCLDGFNATQNHPAIIEKGEALLRNIYSRCQIIEQDNPSYLIPPQDNDSDCGTVISYYAFKKAEDQDLSVYAEYRRNSCRYIDFRLHMAQQLATSTMTLEPNRTYLPQSSSSSSRSKLKTRAERAEKPAPEDKRRPIKSF